MSKTNDAGGGSTTVHAISPERENEIDKLVDSLEGDDDTLGNDESEAEGEFEEKPGGRTDEEDSEAEEDEEEEGESDEGSEDDGKDKEDGEDGEDEEGDNARFKLDPDVANALPEKERKRLEQQLLGLNRRDAQIRAAETDLDKLRTYDRAFADPDTAGPALRFLAEQVAKIHGKSVETMLGIAEATKPADEKPDWRKLGFSSQEEFDAAPEWEQKGFDSPAEYRLSQANEALEKKILDLEARMESTVKPIEDEKQAARNKAQLEQFAKDRAAKVEKRLQAEYPGFKVTPEMVVEALEHFPAFKEKPSRAVEAHFARRIAKHMAQLGSKGTRKGPEIGPTTGRTGGTQLPDDPMDLSCEHFLTR